MKSVKSTVANPAFLEVRGLTKRFGGLVAVDNVSFNIRQGETVGVIGPNGSGKTTLTHLLSGLLRPASESIKFKGEEIAGLQPWEINDRGVATTFQIPHLFRDLTVLSNVLVAGVSPRARRLANSEPESVAKAMLDFAGVGKLAGTNSSDLSHGDRKRLDVARALATFPELLLLDEPFSGLSPAEIREMAESLKRLQSGTVPGLPLNPTMLVVEHRLNYLFTIADRVIVLDFGKIIADGNPVDIIGNPDVSRAYLGKEEIDRSA